MAAFRPGDVVKAPWTGKQYTVLGKASELMGLLGDMMVICETSATLGSPFLRDLAWLAKCERVEPVAGAE